MKRREFLAGSGAPLLAASILFRRGTVGSRPVNPETPPPYGHPDDAFSGRTLRMMVKRTGTFVKATGVPGITITESLEIQVVAEFVT